MPRSYSFLVEFWSPSLSSCLKSVWCMSVLGFHGKHHLSGVSFWLIFLTLNYVIGWFRYSDESSSLVTVSFWFYQFCHTYTPTNKKWTKHDICGPWKPIGIICQINSETDQPCLVQRWLWKPYFSHGTLSCLNYPLFKNVTVTLLYCGNKQNNDKLKMGNGRVWFYSKV